MAERKISQSVKKKKFGKIPLLLEKHLLGELIHTHRALVDSFSREVGITPAKLKLFHEFLHAGREGIGIIDLAFRLGVTPALVTRQVQELEKEGWVKRRTSSRDGRRSIVYLSAKGHNKIVDLHERAHLFEDALLRDINDEDITIVIHFLESLGNKLKLARIIPKADRVSNSS